MRRIGYPRLLSMENFAQPNFELVADALFWMVKRYDPTVNVHDSIETEQHRVKFLLDVTTFLRKNDIHLNSKSLYAANGLAVKELSKFANILQKAIEYADTYPGAGNFEEFKLEKNIRSDARKLSLLSREIIELGTKIHSHLDGETENRSTRKQIIEFSLDSESSSHIKEQIETACREASEELKHVNKQNLSLKADIKSLESLIESSEDEINRTSKRLESIENIRPAFMDEFDKLEKDLEGQHEIYVLQYRNLLYLQHEVDKHRKREMQEQELKAKAMYRVRSKFESEEDRRLYGGLQQRNRTEEEPISIESSCDSNVSSEISPKHNTLTISSPSSDSGHSSSQSSSIVSCDGPSTDSDNSNSSNTSFTSSDLF